MIHKEPVAIDPLALLLRSDIYVKLTLPDPPPPDVAGIREVVAALDPEERKFALTRVKALKTTLGLFEKELAAKGKAASVAD